MAYIKEKAALFQLSILEGEVDTRGRQKSHFGGILFNFLQSRCETAHVRGACQCSNVLQCSTSVEVEKMTWV